MERQLARIAHAQYGVVTRAQLLAAGIPASAIQRRLDRGALLPEHRGVYRVGHRAPSVEARYMAAVLACGDGALLCGRAAAHLLGLVDGAAPPPEVIASTKRRIPGIHTRRLRSSEGPDRIRVRRIPVTDVAWTLVDLAAVLSPRELARACHEAGVRYATTPAQVESVLARRPNSRGASKLRAVLRGDERVVLSKLERRFLELLAENRLPLPRTNRRVGGRRVDCRWPRYLLTTELDGYHFHKSRHAWEQDRRREREAYARGDQFRRYTYGDVVEDPRLMLQELRGLLSRYPT